MRIEEIIDGKIIGINETDNVITIFVRKGDVLYLLKIGKKYKLEIFNINYSNSESLYLSFKNEF